MKNWNFNDYFKYVVFNLLCIMFGVGIFGGMLGFNLFFTTLTTVVGTQLALYYLSPRVLGITYNMEKVKKLS